MPDLNSLIKPPGICLLMGCSLFLAAAFAILPERLVRAIARFTIPKSRSGSGYWSQCTISLVLVSLEFLFHDAHPFSNKVLLHERSILS